MKAKPLTKRLQSYMSESDICYCTKCGCYSGDSWKYKSLLRLIRQLLIDYKKVNNGKE